MTRRAAPPAVRAAKPAPRKRTAAATPRRGIARVISRLGLCSRTEAATWVRSGRVSVNGVVVRDPEHPTDVVRDRIHIDGSAATVQARVYVMLNKPRGIVTSAADERGRETVYALLADAGLPWLAPVGRLDKASEGLLLMSNDSLWAAAITSPQSALDKTYHVQIDRVPDAALLRALGEGVDEGGERLALKSVRELRRGEKNAWLEIVLDEGRNRQIRRVLAAFDIGVLRLIRVAIGELALGDLGKGNWRALSTSEVETLSRLAPTGRR